MSSSRRNVLIVVIEGVIQSLIENLIESLIGGLIKGLIGSLIGEKEGLHITEGTNYQNWGDTYQFSK